MPQLDAIGIIVSDLADAVAFYRLLGLDFAEVDPGDGHAEATTSGGIRVMLDSEESVRSFSDWEAPRGSYRVALAFLCESPADVDELFETMTGAGGQTQLAPFDAPWGQRYATVLDGDGNAVDLFAPNR
jgi:catechol 2,3-dioxygenase-like lactoylglutathione lyase family enzyme